MGGFLLDIMTRTIFSEIKSQLCHSLTLCAWMRDFTSLSLGFSVYSRE